MIGHAVIIPAIPAVVIIVVGVVSISVIRIIVMGVIRTPIIRIIRMVRRIIWTVPIGIAPSPAKSYAPGKPVIKWVVIIIWIRIPGIDIVDVYFSGIAAP